MYSESVVCPGASIGVVILSDGKFPPRHGMTLHVYQLPDGNLASTSNPTPLTGRHGALVCPVASSLEEIESIFRKAMLSDFFDRVEAVIWMPDLTPKAASILLFDEEARRAFAVSLAASGGIAGSLDRTRYGGRNVLDDTPDRDSAAPTPNTPGVIIGQLTAETISGEMWTDEETWDKWWWLEYMSANWLSQHVRTALTVRENGVTWHVPNKPLAEQWYEAILLEWELRQLDLGEFATVEVWTSGKYIIIKEAGAVNVTLYTVPSGRTYLVEVAKAVIAKKQTVATLRRLLLEEGLTPGFTSS